MTTNRKTQDAFFYFTGLCAILAYGAVIYQHAYNIPKWDDFPDILQFLDHWLSASTISEKFSVFISHSNEHILLVNHLVILCQYALIAHLDFTWLIYIGNAFYIGSSLVLWLFFKNQTERAFCFAVIMLTGVGFYAYDSTLWAMTAISNQAVIFFSFLTLYLISRPIKNIYLAMLFATLAVFSQSNGFFVLVVIAGYFYNTKESLNLKRWIFFSIVITGLYLYWFNDATAQDHKLLSVLHELPLQNYFLTIPTLVAYFGASIFSNAHPAAIFISLIIGGAVIGLTALQMKRTLFTEQVILVLAFLLLSILSIAAYRGLIGGTQVVFISRYKMYGSYFLITGVLLSPVFMAKIEKSGIWKFATLFIAALYFACSFPGNLAQANVIDGDLFHSLQYWVEDGDFRRARGFFVKDADSYLFAALKSKAYTPMVLLDPEKIITGIETLPGCPQINNQNIPVTDILLISHKNPNAAGIKLSVTQDVDKPLTITLCSDQNNYQFEIKNTINNEMDSASVFFIARENILPGIYTVWVKKENTVYKLENSFINKVAIR